LVANFDVAGYALINFSVFHVCLNKSPSWRPKFKHYNMWMSLVGCLLCVFVMFLMDWKTALATFVIIGILFYAIGKHKPDANWGSSNKSQTFLRALKGIHSFNKMEDHVKNFRPRVN